MNVSEPIDTEVLLDLTERNLTQKEMAEITGVSVSTLQRRLADLKAKQGLLLQARDLRSLRLTELQTLILDAITPDKIAEASLKELVTAFKVLSERENVDIGKPNEVKGLVHYLVQIEKENIAVDQVDAASFTNDDQKAIEADYQDVPDL